MSARSYSCTFVQQFFVLSRNAFLAPLWGGTFRNDTLIGGSAPTCSRFVLSRNAPSRYVTRQKWLWWRPRGAGTPHMKGGGGCSSEILN